MANRKIVQEKNFLLGWDNVTNVPIFSTDHGATWQNVGGSGGGGVSVEENSVSVLVGAKPLDFLTDIAGGKPFADLVVDGNGVDIQIDKQINYGPLAGSVGPVPTGFSFDAETYRACEVIYYLVKASGELESGHIMMVHDGADAGVVVTKRDSSVLPFTQGDPGVTFTADVNTATNPDVCRLLYTEANGDALYLSVKPRPIRPTQIITLQFVASSSAVVADVPSGWTWNIEINTSDGLATNQQVTVNVVDLLTGTANGLDYTMVTPQALVFAIGSIDGATQSAALSVLGNNQNDTVITGFTTLVGAVFGANTVHTINLQEAGA
jgi:hypothetical protein